jgi:hypothetical protein
MLCFGRLALRLPPHPRALSISAPPKGTNTMTPRQVRRAAERKANKLARKANQSTTATAPEQFVPPAEAAA